LQYTLTIRPRPESQHIGLSAKTSKTGQTAQHSNRKKKKTKTKTQQQQQKNNVLFIYMKFWLCYLLGNSSCAI
jgi:hypothetical protein